MPRKTTLLSLIELKDIFKNTSTQNDSLGKNVPKDLQFQLQDAWWDQSFSENKNSSGYGSSLNFASYIKRIKRTFIPPEIIRKPTVLWWFLGGIEVN